MRGSAKPSDRQVQLDGPARHRITVSAVDLAAMRRIEDYISRYVGTDLLHDVELRFPGCSFRSFFLALRRSAARKRGGNA
jgi:hypothetical protein